MYKNIQREMKPYVIYPSQTYVYPLQNIDTYDWKAYDAFKSHLTEWKKSHHI